MSRNLVQEGPPNGYIMRKADSQHNLKSLVKLFSFVGDPYTTSYLQPPPPKKIVSDSARHIWIFVPTNFTIRFTICCKDLHIIRLEVASPAFQSTDHCTHSRSDESKCIGSYQIHSGVGYTCTWVPWFKLGKWRWLWGILNVINDFFGAGELSLPFYAFGSRRTFRGNRAWCIGDHEIDSKFKS